MENKWLVLHLSSIGEPIMVNMDRAIYLLVGDNGCTNIYLDCGKYNYISVRESIEEIHKLMMGY